MISYPSGLKTTLENMTYERRLRKTRAVLFRNKLRECTGAISNPFKTVRNGRVIILSWGNIYERQVLKYYCHQ